MAIETLKRLNLAKQITTILRKEILANCKVGQRLEAIAEIAKRFAVSYQTVREALSVLEAEGLIDRRSGSGTFVKDRATGRHVAVWCERDIFNPATSFFYRYIPRQLVRFLEGQGIPARLYVGHVASAEPSVGEVTCTEFLTALDEHRLCGVATIHEPAGTQWVEAVKREQIPLVGSREDADYPCVRMDVAGLGRLGSEYLLAHGRRRIAVMHWREPALPEVPKTFELSATGQGDILRCPVRAGFDQAMAAAGVEINPHWIRSDLPPAAPGAGWEEFREIWASGGEKPDGLLVCDDILFLGAAMAILQLGVRVPEDLLVVTHYNKGSGLLCPFPTARLVVDLDEYVRRFGGMLVRLLKNQPVESVQTTPWELLEAPADGIAQAGRAASKRTTVKLTEADDEPAARLERQRVRPVEKV